MKILFAHGLEGSPNGSKPTWMKESLGWEIICPEMSNNGWTIADQTEVIAEAIAEYELSLIHISEPTDRQKSRMPSSA